MPALVEKYGDWFTWSGAPRSKMFARNSSDVTDLQSMIALMRCVCVYVCMYVCVCVCLPT